jgi:type I restriction enzyme S subunit
MSEALKNRKAFHNTTIPVDWDAYELTRVSEKIIVGIASAATHAYRNEGVILFRNQNIKEGYLDDTDILYIDETYEKAHKNKRLKGGDILIARTGYPGTACLVPDKYIGAQSFTTLIVRPKHELIDKEFLCLYVNSEFGQGYFETNQIGGGQKNVNAGTLEMMPIPLPPLPEQKAISLVLRTADAAIKTTEKLIAQKELRKKWLMQKLLTGKKRLKGFGGEWKEKKLSDLFDRVTRKNIEGNTNVVTISAQRGFVRQTDFFNKNIASEITDNYFLVKKGEFCYNKSYSNGYPWGATKRLNDFDKAVVTTLYICFGVKDENKTNPQYFEQYFGANHLDKGLTKIAHEGGRAHGLLNVTPSDFFSLKVTVPSYEEQTAIAQVLQAADKEISLLNAKAEKLREQKKGLMQVLLTGRVRLEIN